MRILSLLIICTITIANFSCSKETNKCNSCLVTEEQAPLNPVKIGFEGDVHTFKVQVGSTFQGKDQHYYGIGLNDMAEQVENLFETFGIEAEFKELLALTIYAKNNESSDLSIVNTSQFLGIGIYYVDNRDRAKHKLYIFEQGSFKYIDKWHYSVSGYITNFMDYILSEELKQPEGSYWILLSGKDRPYQERGAKVWGNEPYQLKKDAIGFTRSRQSKKASGPTTCGSGCSYDDTDGCDPNLLQCGGEDPDPTQSEVVHEQIVNSEEDTLTSAELSSAWDFDFLFDLRDNFMFSTEKGQNYIGYYYQIDDHLDESSISIPFSLSYETTVFMIGFSNKLRKLQSHSTYPSEVFITATDATNLINLLEDWKDLSSDQSYEATIDLIMDDVDYYTGWTNSEIVGEME